MRIATDVVRIFRVMNVSVLPPPDANGDIYVDVGPLVLSAVLDDPESASPHTYLWEQTPVTVPGTSFGTPTQPATTFGPLVSGTIYHMSLTVTSASLQTKNLRFRVLVR